jgi:glycosyltransferase involved in cell wall biosynthesis
MISIIIPLYNQSDKIKSCLESIKNQTLDNYEIIVVNDRSRDHLSKVVSWAKSEFGYKLLWINNQENHGAPYSRNKGFYKSKGEYVLFCDADIILERDALELMIQTLNTHPEAAYAYPSHKHGSKLFKLWPFDAEKLKIMPYIHSTALIRRKCLPASGWDESLKRFQDWDLWLTMLEAGHQGIWIDKVLFKIVGGGHTMSAWMPSFAYKYLPFLPRVKKYKEAMAVIKKKHGINI